MAQYENQSCIDACVRCALECEHCEIACLSEPDVATMAACIRLDKDCAAICWLTTTFMIRRSRFDTDACRLCAAICDNCAGECAKHDHAHSQRCAAECRRCAKACREMAGDVA